MKKKFVILIIGSLLIILMNGEVVKAGNETFGDKWSKGAPLPPYVEQAKPKDKTQQTKEKSQPTIPQYPSQPQPVTAPQPPKPQPVPLQPTEKKAEPTAQKKEIPAKSRAYLVVEGIVKNVMSQVEGSGELIVIDTSIGQEYTLAIKPDTTISLSSKAKATIHDLKPFKNIEAYCDPEPIDNRYIAKTIKVK